MSRRLIDSCISQSTRWNSLDNHFERILYVLLLTHSDPYGRGDCDFDGIKFRIIPGLKETASDIQEAVINLHNAGLIDFYCADNKAFYQIVNFDSYQCFNSKNRHSNSRFIEACDSTVQHCATLCETVQHCVYIEVKLKLNRSYKKLSSSKLKPSGQEGEIPKPEFKKYSFEPQHKELAEMLSSLIKENFPAAQNRHNIDEWANHIRLINKIDKMDIELIENVIRWCQKDSFWYKNILSAGKLRKQFSQLVIKMQSDNTVVLQANKPFNQQMFERVAEEALNED